MYDLQKNNTKNILYFEDEQDIFVSSDNFARCYKTSENQQKIVYKSGFSLPNEKALMKYLQNEKTMNKIEPKDFKSPIEQENWFRFLFFVLRDVKLIRYGNIRFINLMRDFKIIFEIFDDFLETDFRISNPEIRITEDKEKHGFYKLTFNKMENKKTILPLILSKNL
ncbi:hypothetical protein EDEG_01120 [Edhazardia aedis USNM 41457]|uniref:Uncharacterized protein n=1 Tax=Edhazardia aedis (strain USNM 41457) TaxID=1003232 RepID=J9DTQ5_EDHAE|nr:hypothetical protein EDEG_01120 [Edhazardia aedis USNM 41457]|eukprot:EJW04672.1 hypothetical protein EDEG_01120 [Edhazardia aedis USNM 41457]